jgi:hypothetical protein
MTFHSLEEYKRWAESASQEEREAYWNPLSDEESECLVADLEDQEEEAISSCLLGIERLAWEIVDAGRAGAQ